MNAKVKGCLLGSVAAATYAMNPLFALQKPAASIGRVLTMKEARGKGLARPLMLEAVRIAKCLSPVIEIEAQAYLREFYKSLGFVETSDEFLLDGISHIGMRLE